MNALWNIKHVHSAFFKTKLKVMSVGLSSCYISKTHIQKYRLKLVVKDSR